MYFGCSAESLSAARSRLTAALRPSSKSTNVSAGHSVACSSSRVTSSPGSIAPALFMRRAAATEFQRFSG
jgi:hypothetical protein